LNFKKIKLKISFLHSYDVIIDDDPSVLVNKFKEFKARIVFGAEAFCWPDAKLAVRIIILRLMMSLLKKNLRMIIQLLKKMKKDFLIQGVS
jgi:hypothetical protein